MQHGKLSAKIGKKIAESARRARRDDLTVIYDSGEKGEGTSLPFYFGGRDQLGPQGVMGNADIVVADTRNDRVLVICMFGTEGAEASCVLGDMAMVLASEKMKIKGRDFTTDEAQCVLAYRCEETKQEGFGMAQKRVQSYGYVFAHMLSDESHRGIDFTLIARKDYEKLFEEIQRVICHRLRIEP